MRIAITGSIACGKSTVLQLLKERGFPVIDADEVSRQLTAPGGEALPAIRAAFGDCVFDGKILNRKALAERIFSDPVEKRRLESILHPMIRSRILTFLDQHSDKQPVFAEIPLLYESGMENDYDVVWVVSAPEKVRLARLKERDGLSAEDALKRIRAQMPLEEKERRADSVIRTDGPISETGQQVDALLSLCSPASHRVMRPARRRIPVAFGLFTLPVWLRVFLAAVASTLLLTCAVLLIKDYAAHLEIQRQMEQEAAERASHPLYYEFAIRRSAEENQLDPALISAVILCESSFHPNAVSRLGARGLMQIMEETAGWIAHRMGEDDSGYSFDSLFDPETNIRYGTWYLGYLSRRFGADTKKIICAYHAGQGNVESWLHNAQYSVDGLTLDTIPLRDTQQYYDRVSNAMEVYKRYYFPDAQSSGEPLTEIPSEGV